MAGKLSESLKVDLGIPPQSLASTNTTSRFYSMREWGEILFVLTTGAMALDKTVVMTIYKATDLVGTGFTTVSKDVTITANENVTKAKIVVASRNTEVTVALASVLNTQTVIINGLTFTAHTNTTTAATRTFSIAGDDTADAAALAGLINDETYGVPGVTAVAETGTITLTIGATGSIVVTSASGTFTIAVTATEGMQAADTVTINGVVFTADATTTTVADREFKIDGNDTADAAALATCINDATYGVPGITASANTGTITLYSTVPGATTITVASDADAAAVAVSTLEAVAYSQVYAEDLGENLTYYTVGANVATDDTIVVQTVAIRGDGRYSPTQAVADSA